MDEILPKDVYLHLTEFADDRTVIQMLSTNKNYNDPKFFKRILERKYPTLLRYKKKKENWRQFYIRMVFYMSKLKEEFDVPYIPVKKFNPKKLYKYYEDSESLYREIIRIAILNEDIKLMDKFIKKLEDFSPEFAEELAIKKGKLNVVKYLRENYAFNTDIRDTINYAKEEGTKEIVNFLRSIR